MPSDSGMSYSGSSPLTRGKRPVRRDGRAPAGLIPAHAGKTPPGIGGWWLSWAHPRSRGENARRGGPITSGPGSSPLTRGKQCVITLPSLIVGFIPAHAGKTGVGAGVGVDCGAHPRSRGENAGTTQRPPPLSGSSPLTRGKRSRARLSSLVAGLIPTHAGKTDQRSLHGCRSWAHPRSRGENVPVSAGSAWRFGSSPLMRGKLACFGRADAVPGLIPAHTGKTCGM